MSCDNITSFHAHAHVMTLLKRGGNSGVIHTPPPEHESTQQQQQSAASCLTLRFFLTVLSVVLMFAFTLTLWTVTVHLFTAVRTAATGQPQVIGSLAPIIAAPGDDVILPCHLEPSTNVEALTVEWSKPDLKPDPSDRLSRVEYVHLYRDRREVPDMKIQSYVKRTALFTDRLKHGNISLKIMNVTLEDEGRYKCFIPKLKSPFKDSIVQLVVDPNSKETTTTETPLHPRTLQPPEPKNETNVTGGRSHLALILVVVFGVVLVLGGGVCGYLFLKLKHHQQNYDAASDKSDPI